MFIHAQKSRTHFLHKFLSAFIAFSFFFTSVIPSSYAQTLLPQTILNLPAPGTMIAVTPGFMPPMIMGITLYPDNPLMFDFIVDTGDENLQGQALEDESTKLIKYFLASLTVPAENMWVNLSPYEEDRIIPEGFNQTEMGRDMLAQDYLLKQLTASLMYPEDELGQKFWKRVRTKAFEKYGTTEIPMNTFNKVWIVPESASIYENESSVFVVDSHLKVMLEEDYVALKKNTGVEKYGLDSVTKNDAEIISGLSSEIIREILIPEIEKEVNQGKTFSNLRQIFNSMILATWYKQNLKESLLGQVYVDQNKTKGVDVQDKQVNQKIYERYVEAFKTGVYNYIREDYDPNTKEIIPRRYFSGGIRATSLAMDPTIIKSESSSSPVVQGFIAGDNTGVHVVKALSVEVSSGKTAEEVERIVKASVSSSPVEDLMSLEMVSLQNVGDTFAYQGEYGFTNPEVKVLRLTGNENPADILRDSRTRTVLGTAVSQAIASILFAGKGKEGKEVGDGNAVEATHGNLIYFTQTNNNEAVVLWADEGKRDASFYLELNRIYYSGYENGFKDFPTKDLRDSEITILRESEVRISFSANDALEHTNALVMNIPDSWGLAALADDVYVDIEGDMRKPVVDDSRIAGVSFNAPNDAGVQPLELPTTAIPKIARAHGLKEGTEEFSEFINKITFTVLGPRNKELRKDSTQSDSHRHKLIIADARKLQGQYPGLEIYTPGDGDFVARIVSSLGIDLNGRKMVTFGRSGSAESTIATIVAAVAKNGQFNHRIVSTDGTSVVVSAENADDYNENEIGILRANGYSEKDYTGSRTTADFVGRGTVAVSAVTGASEEQFGKTLSGLLKRVNFDKKSQTVTVNVLLVTLDGSSFIVRTRLTSEDITASKEKIVTSSLPARDFLGVLGESAEEFVAASSPVVDEGKDVGGINLNPDLLDLRIKRDGNGIPLPINLQPIHQMRIDGFVPIIINVTPVASLPLLLGLADMEMPFDSADDDSEETLLELGPVDKYRHKYIREREDSMA